MRVMLVLASNSPRRRQLLELGGWTFITLPADIDERVLPGENPHDYVLRLAEGKARRAQVLAPKDAVLLAADTAVIDGEEILGKPADEKEAEAMLRRLRGHTHQVYTALAILDPASRKLLLDCCSTDVPIRDYSDEEMMAYIATGDPLDKAGAYAIQHAGFHPVENLEGCFANVMGMPLCHLSRMLSQLGIAPEKNVPLACQGVIDSKCAMYLQILEMRQ